MATASPQPVPQPEPQQRRPQPPGGGSLTHGSIPSLQPLRPCKTVVQLPPADPRVSRAMLPVDYDRRAWRLLGRMAAAAVLFGTAVTLVAAMVVSVVGIRLLLGLLLAAEVVFAVYFRERYSALNAQPPKHAPESYDPLRIFNRLLEVSQMSSYIIDVQEYLSCWFCGADPSVIRQDNLADLIAYGFWYKSRHEMEACGQGPLLRNCVERMQTTLGFSLPPGYTPGLQVMTHLWEPLRASYRPLLLYGTTEVLALLCRMLLLGMGCSLSFLHTDRAGNMLVAVVGLNNEQLKQQKVEQQEQFAKEKQEPQPQPPQQPDVGKAGNTVVQTTLAATATIAARPMGLSDSTSGGSTSSGSTSTSDGANGSSGCGSAPVPVVLLHGVGLGLLPYLNLMRCLVAAGLPVVTVEYKHVSLRLCSIIPSADDIAAAVVGLMDNLGLEQACVVAHSYGTFVASRIAQLYGSRLQSLALMDPVCFGMFLPSLLANFIYRPPRTNSIRAWIQDQARAFVSQDLHCAAAMARRFYWSDLNLWPHDVPCRTLVALAGGDELIHVGAVMEFLRHYAAKVLFHPDHAHAQVLMDPNWQQQVVADIYSMASSGVGAEGAMEVQRRLTFQPPTPTPIPQQQQQAGEPPPTPLTQKGGAATSLPQKGVQRRITVSELHQLMRQRHLQQKRQEEPFHPLSRPPDQFMDGTTALRAQHGGGGIVRRRWTASAGMGGDGSRIMYGILEDEVPSVAGHVIMTNGQEAGRVPLSQPPASAAVTSHDISARPTTYDEECTEMTEEGLAALAEDLRRHINRSYDPLRRLAPADVSGGGAGEAPPASERFPSPNLAARRPWPEMYDQRLLLELELELAEVGLNRAVLIAGPGLEAMAASNVTGAAPGREKVADAAVTAGPDGPEAVADAAVTAAPDGPEAVPDAAVTAAPDGPEAVADAAAIATAAAAESANGGRGGVQKAMLGAVRRVAAGDQAAEGDEEPRVMVLDPAEVEAPCVGSLDF